MITETIESYKQFMQQQGWNQREGAEAIGCSRQHLNRIINNVCSPSATLCAKMESVMGGKPVDTNLEACKKAYPIGNAFIQFYDMPNTYNPSTNYKDFIWEEGAFHFQPDSTGAWLSYVLYSPINKQFFYHDAIFWKIIGYCTTDGYLFSPMIDIDGNESAFTRLSPKLVYVQNSFSNCAFTINTLHDFIRENIIAYNKIHQTDYIPLFSEDECDNFLEATI